MEPQSYVTCGLCQEGPSPIAVSSVRFLGEVDFEMGTGMQGSCSGELLGLKPMGGGEKEEGLKRGENRVVVASQQKPQPTLGRVLKRE